MLRCRAQVRKFIFVALQRKFRFSKALLCSLHFKLLEATFNRKFITQFGSKILLSGLESCEHRKFPVADKGNGGQPACPEEWKKCIEEEHE
jgi:hypothetical protein